MNVQQYCSRLLITIALLSNFQQSIYAQHSVDSLIILSENRSTSVRSFTEDGERFISLKDLSTFLSLQYYENAVLQKCELRFDSTVLKFTAENVFVVQTNFSTKRSTVHQLPVNVLLHNGLYFSPAEQTLAIINSLISTPVSISAVVKETHPLTAVPHVMGFDIEERKNGFLLRIHLTSKVTDASRTLQVGEWMYVTLPGAVGDTIKLDTTFTSGILKRIQPIQTETTLQLSLQIRGKVATSEIVQDQTSNDLLLTLIPEEVEQKMKESEDSLRRAQALERLRRETASAIAKQKNKWKLDVIVLDPGHGGKDPGTIGVIGTREKDITLGIALKLGRLIERYMSGVKVVYTRKTDRFVELYRRGQIANESEGKLFISIHCNSAERKPSSANGFEIYLLRPGKTEDAIRIAEKENAVVQLENDYEDRYQNLTEENFIILTMAQSAYMKQSERFAELLEETMSAEMEAQRTPVKQAGFYVLVGASMPNVLVETGYLSNPKEEKFLRSPSGQQKIAEAILKAIQRFKIEYEK